MLHIINGSNGVGGGVIIRSGSFVYAAGTAGRKDVGLTDTFQNILLA